MCPYFSVSFLSDVDLLLRVPETLSTEILGLLGAPPKPSYKTINNEDLTKYDAYLLGIPTRFGNMPGQWKVRLSLSSSRNNSKLTPISRRSGMLLVASGLRVPSLASTLASLSQPDPMVVVRRPLL